MASRSAPPFLVNPCLPGVLMPQKSPFCNREQLRFELTASAKDTNILGQCLESGDIEGLGAACFNDLEAVVLRYFPVVHDVKRALTQPGEVVCRSGSGLMVYALCPSW